MERERGRRGERDGEEGEEATRKMGKMERGEEREGERKGRGVYPHVPPYFGAVLWCMSPWAGYIQRGVKYIYFMSFKGSRGVPRGS